LIDPADGGEERLAASEFDLLKTFAENPNRPLTRDWLLEVTARSSVFTIIRSRKTGAISRPARLYAQLGAALADGPHAGTESRLSRVPATYPETEASRRMP
jgi:hypothetical protein